MSASQSWSGLRTLWHAIKRILAVLAMGLTGAMIGGITGAIGTCYVYGIGIFLGLPVGAVGAALVGLRTPVRDVATLFTLTLGSMLLIGRSAPPKAGILSSRSSWWASSDRSLP